MNKRVRLNGTKMEERNEGEVEVRKNGSRRHGMERDGPDLAEWKIR